MKIKKIQLKNKLKVILIESRKSPVVSVQMWVRTGSVHEKKGEEGISHFIEHLVFKGTQQFKMGEIAQKVESSGGELNAYTSFDQTVFYVTISSAFTDTALRVIREVMGFPKFADADVESEREVVIEEIKRGMDSLGRVASQNFFSAAYKTSPYGKPVIGYEQNVKNWPVKKIKEYFAKRYSPQNMFLVVSGDFNSSEMSKKVQSEFGVIPTTKVERRTTKLEPLNKKTMVSIVETQFGQSICYMGWRIPNVLHADFPAIQILAMIFGVGDSSKLVQALRIREAHVNSVGCSAYTNKEDGLFIIHFDYNKEKLKTILPLLSKEMASIGDDIDEEILNRAKISLLADEAFSIENVESLADKMGSIEFQCHNLNFRETYLKRLGEVQLKDLSRVIKKYLSKGNPVVAVATNDKKDSIKAQFDSWLKKAKIYDPKIVSGKQKKIKKFPVPKIHIGKKTGDVEVYQHPMGFKYVLRYSDETPIVAARIGFNAGARCESENNSGASELMARSWLGGTKTFNEIELAKKIEDKALNFQPNAGRNSMGIALSCIGTFQKDAADILTDVLSQSIFPEDVVEREKMVQLEHLKVKIDQPAQICIQRFLEVLFKNHSFSRDMLGSEKSLRSIRQNEIVEFWKKYAHTKNMVATITGPFDKALWLERLTKAAWDLGKSQPQVNESQPPTIDKELFHFEESKKEQSHLVYGFRGLTIRDEDRYTLQVLQAVLAGMGGRLFYELREKNSLAYSVSPIKLEGIDTGYFGAYIGCSPDKVATALKMMKEQFHLLCEVKVSDSELERAKQYIIGNFDIDLQKSSSIAATLLYDELYGLDSRESLKVDDKYRSVTASDLQRVAKKIFSTPSCVSLVGPKNPF